MSATAYSIQSQVPSIATGYSPSLLPNCYLRTHHTRIMMVKVKVKFTLEQAMETQRERKGYALLFL
jgi:hypothetical protein